MVEANFNVKGDLIGLSAEVSMLTSEIITLDDGIKLKTALLRQLMPKVKLLVSG